MNKTFDFLSKLSRWARVQAGPHLVVDIKTVLAFLLTLVGLAGSGEFESAAAALRDAHLLPLWLTPEAAKAITKVGVLALLVSNKLVGRTIHGGNAASPEGPS